MRYVVLSTLFFLFPSLLQAQDVSLNFNSNGSFKIVQFTDIHYKHFNSNSATAIELIKEVLDAEKPDLAVFTGDIIWAEPVKEGLDVVFAPVIERGIPWAYVFGNHDNEFGWSNQEIMDYVMQKPYCLAEPGDLDIKGVGNYTLEVKDKDSKTTKALLYFFDSGSYAPIGNAGYYNWLDLSQINWYRKTSAAYTSANADQPYPALAFFHIPLAEYQLMRTAKDARIIGENREPEGNGKLNSGMFAAMRHGGDVMGVFVGHDHDNDYVGEYYGLCLGYGRYSGGKTVYNNLGKNGCRVIELKEDKREFTTYIRLMGGDILYPVEYPATFAVEK